MTKSLTEQWKDGTLDYGWYYIKIYWGAGYDIVFDNYNATTKMFSDFGSSVKEVLAPVPSYDEVKEMSQKIERLELDNEALEMAHNEGKEINAELVSKTEKLEKQLAIATKALNCCYRSMYYWARMTLRDCKIFCVIDKALKDIESEGK